MLNGHRIPSIILDRFKETTRILTGVALVIGLNACTSMGTNSLYLHNVEKAKQASVANEAADKLNLADQLQVERTNQAKMLARELSLVEEFSIARRDAAIMALLEPRFDDHLNKEALSLKAQRFIQERISELVGSTTALPVVQVRRRIASKIENELRTATAGLNAEHIPVPTFDSRSTETYELKKETQEEIVKEAIKNNPHDNSEAVRRAANKLLVRFVSACKEVVELNKKLSETLAENSGAIANAENQLNKALANKATLKDKLAAGKKEYDEAIAAVKAAQDTLAKDNSKVAEDALQAKIKTVQEALNKLPESAGAFGQKDAAEEQIKGIDTLLLAAAGSSAPEDGDPNTAQAIVAQLPSFYGRAVEIAAIRKAPSLNTLVLEKNRLLALQTDAEKGVRHIDIEIDLLQTQGDALLAETQLLLDADQHLKWAKDANQGKAVTYENLKDSKVSEDAQRHTIMGIAMYLGTFTGPRRVVHETEYRLIDLKHQAVVDRSEIALVLWQTAIAQPTKSLSAYYAGGLKPEQLIELLKALGLGAIAVGVN
ncbi:MAG: hypothetical protein WCZ86_08570 [Desulfurivibrionaceae bacterium]